MHWHDSIIIAMQQWRITTAAAHELLDQQPGLAALTPAIVHEAGRQVNRTIAGDTLGDRVAWILVTQGAAMIAREQLRELDRRAAAASPARVIISRDVLTIGADDRLPEPGEVRPW